MPMKKHGWRCPKCRMKVHAVTCKSCGFDMKPGKKKIAISEGHGTDRSKWPVVEVGA